MRWVKAASHLSLGIGTGLPPSSLSNAIQTLGMPVVAKGWVCQRVRRVTSKLWKELATYMILCASGRSSQFSARNRVLLNVRPTLPWGGGGWVGLAEFQGGWVSNHPPPPQGRVGLCGGLGSIEPVPLLSFFCCRFRVTCLRCIYLSLHVTCACPTPIKGLGFFVLCVGCGGGNARTPQFLSLPHAHKGARILCPLCRMRRG